jgi:hypothetical protein
MPRDLGHLPRDEVLTVGDSMAQDGAGGAALNSTRLIMSGMHPGMFDAERGASANRRAARGAGAGVRRTAALGTAALSLGSVLIPPCSDCRPGPERALRPTRVSGRRAVSAETPTWRAVRRPGANLADHLERLSLSLLKPLIRQRSRRDAHFSERRIHLALQLRRRPARRRPTHGPFSALVEWSTRLPALVEWSTRLPATVEGAALPRSALF